MKPEILLYGLECGERRPYMESLLATQCQSAADIERVKAAASAAGYHSFRVAMHDGLPPDFAAALGAAK